MGRTRTNSKWLVDKRRVVSPVWQTLKNQIGFGNFMRPFYTLVLQSYKVKAILSGRMKMTSGQMEMIFFLPQSLPSLDSYIQAQRMMAVLQEDSRPDSTDRRNLDADGQLDFWSNQSRPHWEEGLKGKVIKRTNKSFQVIFMVSMIWLLTKGRR